MPCAKNATEMMPNIIIDASVVLKWFYPESKAKLALEIYDAIKQGKLTVVAPNFLLVEVMNILIRKKHVESNLVRKTLNKIATCGIVFEDLIPEHMEELQKIVIAHKISAYDGLYLLSAKIHGYQLLTTDQELLKLPKNTIGLEEITSWKN